RPPRDPHHRGRRPGRRRRLRPVPRLSARCHRARGPAPAAAAAGGRCGAAAPRAGTLVRAGVGVGAVSRDALARRIYDTAHLTGSFTLRSGATSTEYFDKYRFEADPTLL